MKNLLKAKRRKFNSKKGITLVELIVAIMILLIVISATVRGLSVSYRSAMMGAMRNDAQSLAQRNCDIIMSSIVSLAEKGTAFTTAAEIDTLRGNFTDHGSYCEINSTFHSGIESDAKMEFQVLGGPLIAYDHGQYAELAPVNGVLAAVQAQKDIDKVANPGKKYQYYTISRKTKTFSTAAGANTYQIYTVTTYVYYTDKGFVTCEGEVCVLPKT
ncbi:MAG: type II secretion system protein [Acutalibacteraceae bacterium]|nr:type II secretion system protein [Acutalibacteraceae bacterium]